MSSERWETRSDLSAAAERFRESMPGWEPPAAYGICEASGDDVWFPVVNVDAHGLPALALSQVCGHRSGTASYELNGRQLHEAIAALAPAEASADYEHPNLWAWRELEASARPTMAVFLAGLDDAASDHAQRRLQELARVHPLPSDIPGHSAPAVLGVLDDTTRRLMESIRENSLQLDQPSLRPQPSSAPDGTTCLRRTGNVGSRIETTAAPH